MSRAQIEVVRSNASLGPDVACRLDDPHLLHKPASALSEPEWSELYDACLDALVNEAPEIETFEAEQSKGVYTVSILGIPGAYFVSAIEFDDEGVFTTLDDARGAAESVHGEFRVADQGDDEQDEAVCSENDPGAPAFPDRLLEILARSDSHNAVEAMRTRILADTALVMLANGVRGQERGALGAGVEEVVSSFKSTLARPQGYISAMARDLQKLPRLRLRVELFLRLNGRLPDTEETANLYKIA